MPVPSKILLRKDEITADFMKLFEQHIADLLNGRIHQRYSASKFASLLFIAPGHLTNTLKLTTGRSPCDFMEKRLLAESEKLLRETELSVAEIGYKFAYHDPTNFTKFFKGMAGITPLQYRKKIKKAA